MFRDNRKERKRKPRVLGIILVLLLLVSLSVGCIDMELMDVVLPHKEEKVPKFVIEQKKVLSYYFNTSLAGIPDTREVHKEKFRILDDTKWMKIEISVNLYKNDIIQKIIEKFLEISGYDLTQRNVTITFTDPKSRVWYEREFNETETIEPEMLYSPQAGIWTLDVSAKGIGVEVEGYQLYDGFDIRVSALEPT